jgi:hypothetical protein
VVGLADRAIVPAATEDRDDVVNIAPPEPRGEIHDKRGFSVYPQRGRREHRPLDAERLFLTQDRSRRQAGLALLFEVHREFVQERLYLPGRREFSERRVVRLREA